MAKSKSGGNPRTVPEGKKQVNFNISETLLYKVKIIAAQPGSKLTLSDIYTAGTEKYVDEYEKEHGKIKVPSKKAQG